MPIINPHEYYVYIVTNTTRKVLYTGVTNNLCQRLTEHYLNRGTNHSFAGKYFSYWLVYFEDFQYINDAIAREKEIKNMLRRKKEDLINEFNPKWEFLNKSVCDEWPPPEDAHSR
jgi:putative endonuclease